MMISTIIRFLDFVVMSKVRKSRAPACLPQNNLVLHHVKQNIRPTWDFISHHSHCHARIYPHFTYFYFRIRA